MLKPFPKVSACSFALLTSLATIEVAAQAPEEDAEDSFFELSPFVVQTDNDSGYLATNVISGTRLNTSLQDLPMSVDVITSELIEDTGATDFNEAISYTAGVFFENPAAGLTANVSATGTSVGSAERSPSAAGNVGSFANNSITIRGFDVPFQMRDGFRIGTSLSNLGIVLGGTIDPVNIDRLEVVRGPGALLYGLSVLSGIVNVLPKRPQAEFSTDLNLTFGNLGFFRYSLDTTGPISKMDSPIGELNYRFAYASEERDDWTQFRETEKDVYIAQLSYRPIQKLNLFAEYFRAENLVKGIGQQFVSDNLRNANDSQRRNEFNELFNWAREFSEFDPAFRWSGPDSYFEREEDNFIFDAQFQATSDLSFKFGAYYSKQETRNFEPRMATGTNNVGTIAIGPRFDRQNAAIGFTPDKRLVFENERPPWIRSPIIDVNDYKTVYYWWTDLGARADSLQLRGEINYRFFINSQEWMGEQNILAGWSSTEDTIDYARPGERERIGEAQAVPGAVTYINPMDLDPIRYNGEPIPRSYRRFWQSDVSYEGFYFLYNGRFFDDRLFLITGIRHDEYDILNKIYDIDDIGAGPFEFPTQIVEERPGFEEPIEVTSRQLSLSYEVYEGINVFGLYSEGVSPNTGALDGLGNAVEPESSESREIGIKFDLFDKKVIGSLSFYQIDRENATWLWGEAPVPVNFVGGPDGRAPGLGFEPTQVENGRLPINYGIDSSYFDDETRARILANEDVPGVLGFAKFFQNQTDAPPQTVVYLDVGQLDEAGFRDEIEAAFADTQRSRADGDIQPYLWPRLEGDVLGHNPSSRPGGGNTNYVVPFKDRAEGFDFQVLYRPVQSWQIIFNYSYTERETTSGFFLVDAVDINTGINYGTEYDLWVRVLGRDAFEDPTRASTAAQGGPFLGTSLYLRPNSSARLWTKYDFDEGFLEGFSLGGGVIYQGSSQTALSIGGAELRENLYRTPESSERYRFDLTLSYKQSFEHFDLSLRLNVFNVLDDTYDVTFASYTNIVTGEPENRRTESYYEPRSYRVSFRIDF